MLDVHRRDHVDSRVEQVFDVLVALGVARARGIGVGQLVDQADGRPARQDGVDVHLAEGHAAVLDDAGRDDLEVADLLLGLGAAVGLDQADDDVDPLRLEPVPFAEHRVGLAHAGRRAQVDLEPAPRLAADQVQELLGSRAMEFRGGHGNGPRLVREPRSVASTALFLVERQVQEQHVDARRGAEDRARSVRHPLDQGADLVDRQALVPAATRGAW